VTEALERLMERTRQQTAVYRGARHQQGAWRPTGAGFFDCARRLGRFAGDPDGQDAWAFHAAELNAVFARWGGSRNN
jgi:hypothetical protein